MSGGKITHLTDVVMITCVVSNGRGVSILKQTRAFRSGQLPKSSFVKLMQIISPEATASALFDYICVKAHIDQPNRRTVLLSPPIHATPHHLPKDLPEEN